MKVQSEKETSWIQAKSAVTDTVICWQGDPFDTVIQMTLDGFFGIFFTIVIDLGLWFLLIEMQDQKPSKPCLLINIRSPCPIMFEGLKWIN